jgi:hypothetical protein
MEIVNVFFNIIAKLSALMIASVTALWVYAKYILERGFLPPVEFYLTGKKIGRIGQKKLIQVNIHLKNCGTTPLVARNIRLDLRYITKNASPEMMTLKPGRTDFPSALAKSIAGFDPYDWMPEKIRRDEEKIFEWRQKKQRGILVLAHDTFVQAGVNQAYPFVTHVDDDAQSVLLWASFEYAQKPSPWQQWIFRVSRGLGLIQFSLEHVSRPHTAEEVIWVADP